VDNQHTLESNHTKTLDNIREINDYSDMQIVNKNNNGSLNDSLDIQDNIKRAQSSHGVFGRNNNKMNL